MADRHQFRDCITTQVHVHVFEPDDVPQVRFTNRPERTVWSTVVGIVPPIGAIVPVAEALPKQTNPLPTVVVSEAVLPIERTPIVNSPNNGWLARPVTVVIVGLAPIDRLAAFAAVAFGPTRGVQMTVGVAVVEMMPPNDT